MLAKVAALAALGGFLFGYDLGLIGGAMLGISQAFNITSNSTKEAIVGAAKFGAFFGTFIGGVLMLRYGRRFAIAFESLFFVAGPIVMAAATGASGLVIGRFLVGLGIGASAIVVPAYLAEIAPAAKRGAVVQTYEVMLTLGMLSAGVVNWILTAIAGPSSWRWMVGLPAAPGALLLVSLLLLPESPRWLVLRGQLDLALTTLHRIIRSSGSSSSSSGSVSELGTARLGNSSSSSAVEGGSDAAQEAKALAQAEDELLLLWSSVAKEQAAGLELRQQGTAAAGAGRAGRAPVLNGSVAHSAAAAATTVASVSPTQQQQQQQQQTQLSGAEAAVGGGGGRATFTPTPAPDELFTIDEAENGNELQLQKSHQQHQQQQQWSAAAADNSQSEQLLSRSQSRSTYDDLELNRLAGQGSGWKRPGGQGLGFSRLVELKDWVKGWMRGNSSTSSSYGAAGSGTLQQQQQQQQFCEPGQEATVWASLVAMLSDVVSVMKGPERAAFAIAATLAIFDQATASTAVINYAPEVLSSVLGVTEQGSAILYPAAISVTKCIGVGIALLVVDAWGRKPLLVWGGVGCGAALLLAAIGLAANSVALFLLCLCMFIFSFSLSWAGLYWVVVSEIFSMGAKSPATSAATSLLFLTGAFVNFLFLSLISWLGAGAFGVFAAVAFASAWYVHRVVPETKGKTLVEIQALLAAPGGGAAQVSGGVVRYGRWRGWDWGRSAAPASAAAAAAAARGASFTGDEGSRLVNGASSSNSGGQQEQQQQQQNGLGAGRHVRGSRSSSSRYESVEHCEGRHLSPDAAAAAESGVFWQHWLQRQQQQSSGASGLSLPLGMQLAPVGLTGRRLSDRASEAELGTLMTDKQ